METASGYSTPRSYRHSSYHPEYHPSPPPPDQGRPGPPPARAPQPQRRNTWPPPVTCEDEAVSLAKEAGTAALLKDIGKDEAQLRGTVDQDPIVQDVEELSNQFERRFVLSGETMKDAASTGIPTPPTSEDERARKMKRRPSRLQIDLEDRAPEVQGRTASPYAISQPTKLRQQESSSSSQYLSPTTATPTESRRRENRYSTSKAPSPRRETCRSPGSRLGSDYFSAGYASDQAIADDDWDPRDVRGLPKGRRDGDGRPSLSRGTDVVDFATPPSTSQPIRRMNLDARRNTDSASTLPTLRIDKSRRPSPLMTAAAMTGAAAFTGLGSATSSGVPSPADLPLPRSREPSYASSRGVSPATSIGAEPCPPRSARLSADYSRGHVNGSAPSSGLGSASVSRPASPSPCTPAEVPRTPGGLPKTDLDWSTLLAANAARKSKPPSRLATSMRQDSIPDPQQYSRSFTAPPPRHANAVPYPDRSAPQTPATWMPSEPEEQYFSAPTASQPPSSKLGVPSTSTDARDGSRAASPAGSHASYTSNVSQMSAGSRPSRPSMVSRHSMTGTSPTVDERPSSSHRRVDSFTASSQTKKELTALLRKGLPECPRSEPVAGYDDWYTVIGAPGLSFCPNCVDNVFERTLYRPSIRRLPQLNFSSKVTCAFGSSPWLRLAWLLTLQQHRTDLTLLKDLAEVEETSEPCPGSREAVRSWYGLRDSEGYFIRDFRICYADVRKIERLLPTLNGFFVRLPQRASYDKYVCAIRADGNRFSTYLDALIATHERAMASRKGADAMPFINLVEHKMRIRECARDNMLLGGLWHFIPSIPSLTVCEDCYESVVEPEVRKDSDVAMRFNRTVQPVYGEGTTGTSCQLYSPRMRRIFARACQDNDLKYLAKKAKERRDAELRLQERYRDVKRKYERLMRDGSLTEDDEWRLNRESSRITEEWQDKWE